MYRNVIKRLLDILLGLCGFPFFILSFIIIAPLIKMIDNGPVFYCAKRLGKNGKIFNMYKYRSMQVNAPDIRNKDGSTYNSEDDPRVTKIGKLLRKTSLDEIPQVINVIVGDMSVVGPRPNLPGPSFNELPQIEQDRMKVRPGITGYNQAYYRNSAKTDEKYVHDTYYVEHMSFLLDVKILLKTIVSVIRRENIYSN